MSRNTIGLFPSRDWSIQLIVLALFIALVFATGGGSRPDIASLVFLRPLSIVIAGFGLLTIRREHFRRFRVVWIVFGSATLLAIAHVVPLPPSIWHNLPGREIIVSIDAATGLGDVWRPFSMHPEGTWNALYSLSVPFAALLLASQLNTNDHARLFGVIIVFALISGLIGVLQAGGSDVRFYRISSETAGLFANRNHQAALLACLFPMLGAIAAGAHYFSSDPRAPRLVAATCIIALAPLIIVTGSRMGLIVGTVGFMSLVFMRWQVAGKGGATISSTVFQLAVAVIMLGGMIFGTVYLARDTAFDRLGGLDGGPRFPAWQAIVDFIPQYMPWGTGVGTFAPIYQIHENARLLGPKYFNHAHNDWLDLVLTTGVPGVILAAIAVLAFIASAKKALKARGLLGHLHRVGVVVILILAFASVTDYPVRTPILSAILAIAAIWATGKSIDPPIKESTTPHA